VNQVRSNIQLKAEGTNILFKWFFFSGGEPHVEIELPEFLVGKEVCIEARLGSPQGFMVLLALTDAIKRCGPALLDLLLPYFPGARQDREEAGYALSVKMYADLINAQGYDSVFILDPHSPVTPALLDRVIILDHIPLVETFLRDAGITPNGIGIICPDAGAERRTLELAFAIGCDNIVFARKKRDPRTGSLSGFSLDSLPTEGTYLIADDLCDGGGTFCGLAEEYLKDPKGTGSLLLWVTHGIFSKGLEGVEYMSKFFTRIGCSDSFPNEINQHPQLTVVPYGTFEGK
jgi:ribose-phosphate pyrophosphokinase